MTYPNRLARSGLGPSYRDAYPADNPETDLAARVVNHAFWQLAGMNLAVPWRAALVAEWDSGAFDISYQEEAWNPEQTVARPVLARSATGVYTYTLPSTAPDADGASQAIVATDAQIIPQKEISTSADIPLWNAWVDSNGVVQMKLFDAAGSAEDGRFMLLVL